MDMIQNSTVFYWHRLALASKGEVRKRRMTIYLKLRAIAMQQRGIVNGRRTRKLSWCESDWVRS